MPASTLTVFNPLDEDEIFPEEKQELLLPDIGYRRNLFVAPWRSLVASGKIDLIDSIPHDRCAATILKFELEDAKIKEKIAQLGFSTLFCTSTDRKWPIRNIAYPDYISDRVYSNDIKDIPFSFVGWENNKLRQVIFERYKSVPSVIKRDFYGIGVENERNKAHATEYLDILSRTRFSLCPRGVGSGTKRFWESLKTGAIPILISDALILPNCWDWNNTIIRVGEQPFIRHIHKLTTSMILPKGREEILRENCYQAAQAFSNPTFLANYIQSQL